MPRRQRICLHNHRRTRLTVVAACRNRHHIAALHSASNSETDSVQRIAADSSDRSKPATCLATGFRTALERASGTTRRNSRKPRVRRRSRIAFIRSAVRAMASLQSVTRYTVTRYGIRIKRFAGLARRLQFQPYECNSADFSSTERQRCRATQCTSVGRIAAIARRQPGFCGGTTRCGRQAGSQERGEQAAGREFERQWIARAPPSAAPRPSAAARGRLPLPPPPPPTPPAPPPPPP